jgi:hypothetical protein
VIILAFIGELIGKSREILLNGAAERVNPEAALCMIDRVKI